jgi:hypothetical protein
MITSDRHIYIAAHITKEVKIALVKEAFERGMSMSHLIHVVLKKELIEHENVNH